MGFFGWSLPPGCTTLPGEEEGPCEICGQVVDDCICQECPECGDIGNPFCYKYHGLKRSERQKFYKETAEREWKSEIFAYWESERQWQKDFDAGLMEWPG